MALICQAWSYTSPLRAARKFLPLGEHTTTMSFPSNDGLIRSIGLVFDLWHSPLALGERGATAPRILRKWWVQGKSYSNDNSYLYILLGR